MGTATDWKSCVARMGHRSEINQYAARKVIHVEGVHSATIGHGDSKSVLRSFVLLDSASRPCIPPMDLARFLLNSLYGSILRSTTETTDDLAHDACSLLSTDAVRSNN